MPTIIYADGYEHRTISALDFTIAFDDLGIFAIVTDTGANANIVTTGQRTGNAAIELSPDGTTVSLHKLIPGTDPAVSVVGVYKKWTTLPVADSIVFSFWVASGSKGRLWFNATTGKFHLAIGDTMNGTDVGPVLTTGVYYLIDLRYNVSANPSLLDGQIDGGTNVQVSLAQAATTVTRWVHGQDGQTTVWTMIFDDFVASNTSADYPLGAHKVLGLFPNGDGTHVISGAGDFDKGDGTDILDTTTDAWLEIDDWITGVADTTTYVQDTAGASTEYTEHTFDDTTEATIWAVVGAAAGFSANTQACLLTVRVVDSGGATVADIFPNVDVSETVLNYRSALVQQNPTQAQVNAYKVRIGLSGDVAPDPRCSAVMLQYVVPEAVGQTIAVGQVAEIDLAQAIAWAPKNRLVGQVSELDLAQAITALKTRVLAQAAEVDLAQAIGKAKTLALGQATELDLAQVISWAPKRRLVGPASEVDLAQVIGKAKGLLIGQVAEVDLAQIITRAGGGFTIAVGQASEIDLAQPIAWAPKRRLLGQASELDLTQAIGKAKRLGIGQVAEVDLAQLIGVLKLRAVGQVAEIDLAQVVGRAKRAALGQASEIDLAQLVQVLLPDLPRDWVVSHLQVKWGARGLEVKWRGGPLE